MTTESRARYLIFALTIRKLTDALIELVEEGKRAPDLNKELKEVLASIESTVKRPSVKTVRDRGTFGHFEGAATIDEVVRGGDRAALIQKLNSVIEAKTIQEQRKSALKAIDFFDALESRALYRYNHPPKFRPAPISKPPLESFT